MKTHVMHPLEVAVRIGQFPKGDGEESAIQVLSHLRVTLRAEEMDNGCREFSLDGVHEVVVENLQAFYRWFAKSRIRDVKAGEQCTIIMYGPTSAGKTYTMFGAAEKEGVAFHALS